ncbi:T9SS type A sorting domain-containing protein [Roseimarinus sediminis]|uniref:T9SS type A sorting domain-containing protein n=1 Tax=Roseimarinus sediminis TaxID=1610899 RepID=UPI003D1E7289
MKKQLLTYFFALAFIFSASAQDYSGYTKCLEQDSLALVAFYNATDGPNWKSNQDGFSINDLSDNVLEYHTDIYPNAGMGKWLEGPVKDWFGVLLEKQQLGNTTDSVWRVIHLLPTISRRSAGDNNLKGYVPKEVGLLTALKWFKVNGNIGLKGTELPDELFQENLEAIDIEGVYFSGILSEAFRNCINLSFCNLRYNLLDSIPTFDFWTPEQIVEHYGPSGDAFYVYNNQISFANWEASVKYFQTFSNPGDIKYEARQLTNMGREREIIVSPGEKVTLSTNVGGENGEYKWYKKGFNTYKSGSEYTINSVSASDTGEYKALVVNELVRLNDLNVDYVNSFSKPIYVRFTPSTPVIKHAETSYSGNTLQITFNKPMVLPSSAQSSEFEITSGGKNITVTNLKRTGRLNDTYVLELSSPVINAEEVILSYTQGTIKCANGGELQSFNNLAVQNKTRVAPLVVSAKTRVDGSGILITFDRYIDPVTFNVTDFVVNSSTPTAVATIVLNPGPTDPTISKTLELVLTESLSSADEIIINYTKGKLNGLYGGALQSFGPVQVTNLIVENRQAITITVEDGTQSLNNIFIGGDLKSLPFALFDDGTNGDATSGDHIWSKTVELSPGSYTWTVLKRTTTVEYDTVRTTDGNGIITIEITPNEINTDEIISEGRNLVIEVSEKNFSGDTFFGYRNNKVTFILDLDGYETNAEDLIPYLMGIQGDWTTGVQMESFNHSASTYITTVGGYNVGDEISFNFRLGDTWENQSAEKRWHTITGNDTIYATFGIVTAINEWQNDQIKVYPNPAKNQLFISSKNNTPMKEIKIYNLFGQCTLSLQQNESTIDISQLENGFYMMLIIDENDNTFNTRFLKEY